MAMLTEQEFLIREIAADPESDVPRLIYADWLEERGDPQGEFIRVQCELARLPEESDEAAWLRAREAALLRQYRVAWVADVSAGIRWNSFYRGFVEHVILDGTALVSERCQALRRAPIRDLGIVLRTPEQVAALADSPEFRQLRTLRLGGSPLGNEGIQRLVQSANFPRLKALWLSNCGIGFAGAAALASCEALSEVQELVLVGNPLGDGGADLRATTAERVAQSRLIVGEILSQLHASNRGHQEPVAAGEERARSLIRSMFAHLQSATRSTPPSS